MPFVTDGLLPLWLCNPPPLPAAVLPVKLTLVSAGLLAAGAVGAVLARTALSDDDGGRAAGGGTAPGAVTATAPAGIAAGQASTGSSLDEVLEAAEAAASMPKG